MSKHSNGPFIPVLHPGSDLGIVADADGMEFAEVDSTRTGNAASNTHLLAASFDLFNAINGPIEGYNLIEELLAAVNLLEEAGKGRTASVLGKRVALLERAVAKAKGEVP